MDEFLKLYREGVEIVDRHIDAAKYDVCFSKILRFIKDNPSLRTSIETFFCDIVEKGPVIPYELIAFCMHELRWSNVRRLAEERIRREPTKPNLHQLMSQIIDAYNDDWVGRLFYAYYTPEQTQRGARGPNA